MQIPAQLFLTQESISFLICTPRTGPEMWGILSTLAVVLDPTRDWSSQL